MRFLKHFDEDDHHTFKETCVHLRFGAALHLSHHHPPSLAAQNCNFSELRDGTNKMQLHMSQYYVAWYE